MTLVDTRLGPGTLTIGAVERGQQIANVSLEPKQDSNDGTPTLADPDPLPEVTEAWSLKGSVVQDFEDPDGIVNYCMDNALSVVPFVWTPNTDAGVQFSGNVLVTSLPIGGDVAKQNTSDFDWAVQGTPVRNDGAGLPAGVTSRTAAIQRARNRTRIVEDVEATTTEHHGRRAARPKVTT